MAEALQLPIGARMVDLCAGTGDLAAGMSSFVSECQVVDIEPDMLRVARSREYARSCKVTVVQGKVEDLQPSTAPFSLATIGRALHWLDRGRTIATLSDIIAPDGYVAICDAGVLATPWGESYRLIRDRYAASPRSGPMSDGEDFFSGTRLKRFKTMGVRAAHWVPIDHLIERAFSYSRTSRANLGTRAEDMAHEMRAMLSRHATRGMLHEPIFNSAVLYRFSA